MHKINEYIIYKKEVCKIKEIIPKYYKDMDYYLLSPLSDDTLTIKVPISAKDIRNLISKKEVSKIIKNIPNIEVIDTNNLKLEETYKKLIANATHEDLIKIIKTAYLRNKERLDNNKKTTDKDNYYFNLAEKYLYEEFSIVLNKTYEETKNYVIKTASLLSNE